ncbi:MAG: hypothetical protein KAI71_03165 [Candidatus Pacebacteria bacterium]|nr:hypothetical protein [Candidatus Paceibacterota bacterium]
MSEYKIMKEGRIPEDMVIIGRWNTAGGKHLQVLVCKKNTGPESIKEAFKENPRFMDELSFLEVQGENLVICTSQARRGIWIGNNGWRIKGLKSVLGKGRVEFRDLFSISDGKWTVIETSVGFLNTCNFGPGTSLCCELCDLMEPYKAGHTEIGAGDQRVGKTSYRTEVKEVIEKFVTDNRSQIVKALIQEKIEAWFFNPLYAWEGTIKGDWEYTVQYCSNVQIMKLENIRDVLRFMTEIKRNLIEEKEETGQPFSFVSPPLVEMLTGLVSEVVTGIPETLEELNSQLVDFSVDIGKTIQNCRECYDSESKKYVEVPKIG